MLDFDFEKFSAHERNNKRVNQISDRSISST